MTGKPRRRICFGRAVGSNYVLAAVAALAVGSFAVACSPSGDNSAPAPDVVEASTRTQSPTPIPSVTPAPSVWSPVLQRGPLGVAHRGRTVDDPRDAPVKWVDLKRVNFSSELQPAWGIGLGAQPPKARELKPGRLIAYGVVLDTDGDEVPDYEIGIDNAAPERGDFHVWVTNLATGVTEEQVGPPYGFPVEFAHPDEGGEKAMHFTFLGASGPPDLKRSVQFYVWAAESRDGEIVASDYAPDDGWMGG